MADNFTWNQTFHGAGDPRLEHCGSTDGEPIAHRARTVAERQREEPGVRVGDTEFSICKKFNITPGCFRKWNNLPRQTEQPTLTISAGKAYIVGYKAKPPTTVTPSPVVVPPPVVVVPPPTTQGSADRRSPLQIFTSEPCLAYMRSWERPPLVNGQITGKVFRDTKGSLTIGFGHFIKPEERLRWAAYDPEQGGTLELTMLQMEALFREDVARLAEADLKKRILVPLRQHEYDALADFIFHRGAGALLQSGLQNYINSKPNGNFDYGEIQDCFMLYAFWFNPTTSQWEYNAGFESRRREEIDMFRYGKYTLHR
ncbi:MAG: LysM peptidoglycan-binding domain-containing protein [Saprospirales bacterium]|nr:LysM peptidoglycan-binding domain-containing protein [Saprospirales bacterium]